MLQTDRGPHQTTVQGANDDPRVVALLRWQPRSDFNFSYKEMSEDMGPCEREAPAPDSVVSIEPLSVGEQVKEEEARA